MSTETIRVLAISGSLRSGSFNTAVVRTAIDLARERGLPLDFEVAEIRDIPLYDEDVRSRGLPEPVARFRAQVGAAQAILVVTPEYNYSLPGPLKNAIDWASRPPAQPFAGKPLAIMGASGGASGTMRAQYHLRQVAVFLDMLVLNKPEVFVRGAADKIADGRVHDDATRAAIAEQLGALVAFARRVGATSG